MKIYVINHCYEVDGGFGDSVYVKEVVKITTNKKKAKAYERKWSRCRPYAHPYSYLTYGRLVVEEKEAEEDFDIEVKPKDFEYYEEEEKDFKEFRPDEYNKFFENLKEAKRRRQSR